MSAPTIRLPVEVVLLCDPISEGCSEIDHLSSNGDRPDPSSLTLIREGLLDAVENVTHYADIQGFIDNIGGHRNSIVLPYWFGEVSRNRHALVPAICESYGLPYVGADAYTKIVCNDKHLSKVICGECGIRAPAGFIVTCFDDLSLLSGWTYPAVVKPICQGSSLGISHESLVHDAEGARRQALCIAEAFGWPVLIEEMLIGREVSICMIGDHVSPPEMRAISWAVDGDADFLNERLFTYALKYLDGRQFTPIVEDCILSPTLRESCKKLFRMLDKVEVMRVDGRMTPEGFCAFELSPDLDLRPDGELATVFGMSGYAALLQRLIGNALKRHRGQAPVNDEDKVISCAQSMLDGR